MTCNVIVYTFQKAVFWDYRATNNVFLMVSQIHSDKKNKWQTGLRNKRMCRAQQAGSVGQDKNSDSDLPGPPVNKYPIICCVSC